MTPLNCLIDIIEQQKQKRKQYSGGSLMFCLSNFWFLVTFGNEVTKLVSNLCLHFARQDGQEGKKLKWPKYQKPKDENMGWTNH